MPRFSSHSARLQALEADFLSSAPGCTRIRISPLFARLALQFAYGCAVEDGIIDPCDASDDDACVYYSALFSDTDSDDDEEEHLELQEQAFAAGLASASAAPVPAIVLPPPPPTLSERCSLHDIATAGSSGALTYEQFSALRRLYKSAGDWRRFKVNLKKWANTKGAGGQPRGDPGDCFAAYCAYLLQG